MFGLVQSPFLLVGTLKQHLESLRVEYPEHIEESIMSLFVDDVIRGRDTIEQARELKKVAVSVFQWAGFDLNKWYSNPPELEANTH